MARSLPPGAVGPQGDAMAQKQGGTPTTSLVFLRHKSSQHRASRGPPLPSPQQPEPRPGSRTTPGCPQFPAERLPRCRRSRTDGSRHGEGLPKARKERKSPRRPLITRSRFGGWSRLALPFGEYGGSPDLLQPGTMLAPDQAAAIKESETS
ncbi:hypothetical protein P4O66_021892 [Electrophorus voltai]|uniref:Uncharacterized protein n=1 Tax=Electrophorus voltai TaxID=2609070 RepID=A0AAD8ZMU9_9TELE|nr:hypothetical protein P4O66_021892 [Electrophorus voltai]